MNLDKENNCENCDKCERQEEINANNCTADSSDCSRDCDINCSDCRIKTKADDQAEAQDPVTKLQTENADLKNKLLLAFADNENLRKRFDKEKEDLLKYSTSKFASDILHVMDNVERAIASIPENDTFKNVKEGMEMNKKEILNILSRNKINKIEVAAGDEFNPHEHQAMMEEENPDLANDTIGKILQNGYKLHERILRPSMVSVVKNKQ